MMSARQKKKAEEDWWCQAGWGGCRVKHRGQEAPPLPPPASDTGVKTEQDDYGVLGYREH